MKLLIPLVVFVTCLQVPHVFAQPEATSQGERVCLELPLKRCLGKDAYDAYLKGKRAFGASKHLEALHAFEEAYRLQPDPRLKWNRAATLVELGDHVQAARELDSLVELDASLSAHSDLREQALTAIKALEGYVRTLNPTITPEGAFVHVDGALVGTAPLARPVRLDQTRPHELRVNMPGYEERVVQLAITDASPERIDLEPAAMNVRPASPTRLPVSPELPLLQQSASPLATSPAEPKADASFSAATWVSVGALAVLLAVGVYVVASQGSEPSKTDLGRVTLF
jgi:hypothetical protein